MTNFFKRLCDSKENSNLQIIEQTCPLLEQAVNRYKNLIQNFIPPKSDIPKDSSGSHVWNDINFRGNITSVNVVLTDQCHDEDWPKLGMDESCKYPQTWSVYFSKNIFFQIFCWLMMMMVLLFKVILYGV